MDRLHSPAATAAGHQHQQPLALGQQPFLRLGVRPAGAGDAGPCQLRQPQAMPPQGLQQQLRQGVQRPFLPGEVVGWSEPLQPLPQGQQRI